MPKTFFFHLLYSNGWIIFGELKKKVQWNFHHHPKVDCVHLSNPVFQKTFAPIFVDYLQAENVFFFLLACEQAVTRNSRLILFFTHAFPLCHQKLYNRFQIIYLFSLWTFKRPPKVKLLGLTEICFLKRSLQMREKKGHCKSWEVKKNWLNDVDFLSNWSLTFALRLNKRPEIAGSNCWSYNTKTSEQFSITVKSS